ncbi:hypothetical protein BGZ65_004331 [Modicella reniformis]|uniref:Pentacotripeptide-repeat region of PRORP domain-containing protein n=1 Tax=Modicella reniformis TaxID=1440133 RepID=A0A9P6M8Y8_9FUNG|nr:hypothetical protein BGZ65_004331 [Modicella reniformis]
MSTGPQSVEILRKSVYQRDPLSTWWPLYEEVAGHWRKGSQSRAVPDQGISLVRTDFMRFIGALKVSASLTPASGHLEKLELIFEDFHMAINTPKSNVRVYSAFLTTLCFWKMRELLPDWIQRIKSKIVTSGSRFPQEDLPSIRESVQEQYYDLMRVLANMNQIEAMTDCLEDLKARNMDQLRPTTKAYDMVLEANMKRKDTESAMRIFQEMQDQGFPPQLMTFNVLLQGHLENKDARAAQRVLESLLLTDIQPDIYTFNLLMSGYLNMGEIETVIGFYKGLGEYGLTPNSKTYRILMKTHLRQGQVDRVINLFCKLKESQQTELHPGPEDYRILVQALASNDRMTDALRVLRELIETAKVPVTTPIYNVFLNQYAREGQVGKARRILDRIISEKLPVIDGCINPLIRAYLTQGDLDKVEEMANLMSRHGVQLSRTTYNIMINATKNSGDLSGTWKMYKSMLEDGVKPDVWTYNTLLDILISKLSPTQDNTNRKRDLNAATEEQIEEYMPQIETLLQEMKSRGIRPDVVTYGKLIHQYVILRDMEHAETMFHDMLKSGITPNGFVFNTLMNGFTMFDDMEKALELFRRMPKYGVGPDATTFTTLIKGYANTKQFTLARDFANSLQQRTPKISLDQYCFHTLIQLAQKSHRPGMALDFFEMMRGRGMEPDKVTFTILIEALSREFAQTVSPSSKTKSGIWGRDRRTTTGNRQAESTAEAVESLLGVIQQDKFPLKPSEVTTVISAYFRLGRPLAAIEFFKTSFWQGNPKLNTTNCGAMFNGLLAQEYRGRYDGIVLNLYSLMLTSTKEIIRAEEEDRRRSLASVNEEPQSHKSPGAGDSQEMKDCRTSWSSSLPMSSSSSRNAMLKRSETKSSYVLSSDLPALDLILINILFQAFYKRNNWKIVLQLWQDLESVGAEKLYPFEMPLEFLGWAAQAYHMTSRRESSTSPSRTEVEDPGNDSYSQHQQEEAKSRAEMAKKLLRRLWGSHPRMGATWSTKIYGYNMFKTYTPSNSSSSPPPSLKTTATSRASPHPSSLLLSYLSDHTDERNHRHVDRDMNESKDDKEDERS